MKRPISLLSISAVFACAALLLCGANAKPVKSTATTAASESKSLHEWSTFDFPNLVYGYPGIHPDNVSIFQFKYGTADLQAVLRSGTTTGKIDVSVSGIPAGAYTVSAVTESSSSTVILGGLTVVSDTIPVFTGTYAVDPPVAIPNLATVGGAIVKAGAGPIFLPNFTTGSVKFGGAKNPFPAGFNPFDVASISISDSTGATVTTATVTPVQNGYLNAVSPLVAGTSAPGATGFAVLHADTPPHFIPLAVGTIPILSGSIPIDPIPIHLYQPDTGHIAVHAQGLPASTSLTYAIDGTDIGAVTSGSTGNLTVYATQGYHGKIPASIDMFSVTSITVHDASGNIYVSAGF